MLQFGNEDFRGFTLPQYPGIIVVYFKQNNCGGCITFDPMFYDIERENQTKGNAIQFAVVNLTTNPQILKSSGAYLDRTPLLMIFYNGVPFAKYKGQLVKDEIFSFIDQVFNTEINKGFYPNKPEEQFRSQRQALQVQQPPMGRTPMQQIQQPPLQQPYSAPYYSPPQDYGKENFSQLQKRPNNVSHPLHMQTLKGGGRPGVEQLYGEDLSEGYFDSWDAIAHKDKWWVKDLHKLQG